MAPRPEIIPTAGLAAAPRADMDPVRKINRRGRRFVVLGWVTIGLMIPIGLLAMIGSLRTSNLVDEVESLSVAVAGSDSRGTAQVSIENWAASYPDLSDLRVVTWVGSRVVSTQVDQADQTKNVTIEVHRFRVESDLRQFDASVTVATDSRGGVEALGTPALESVPLPISDGWETNALNGIGSSTASTDDIEAALDRWIDAYTSTDPDALRLSTGDPSTEHVYIPIGRRRGEFEVEHVALPDTTDDSVVVARVRFEVFEAVGPTRGVSDASTTTTTTEPVEKEEGASLTMDVRIDRANTGSPTVTAWGAVGTGVGLVPYENAATGEREVSETNTTAAESTTTTATTAKNSQQTTTTKATVKGGKDG